MVKRLLAMRQTWVWSLGREDPPWRRKWQPTPVLLPGKFHGQRSLVGYSPWDRKESNTTERLHFTSFTQHKWNQMPSHSISVNLYSLRLSQNLFNLTVYETCLYVCNIYCMTLNMLQHIKNFKFKKKKKKTKICFSQDRGQFTCNIKIR